jgi:hypothetical protein
MTRFFETITTIAKKMSSGGFILPFTMLISVLVLLVMGSIMTLLSKQLYFSRIYKQSQSAYYAADDAIACAIEIDDTYVGSDGLGIFPSDPDDYLPLDYIDDVLDYVNLKRAYATPPLTAIGSLNDIKCAQSSIFDPTVALSNFEVSSDKYVYSSPSGPEEGKTSTYTMRMPLGDGSYRCARVTVNKTQSFRQIIAQGYAKTVDGSSSCALQTGSVERAVVNTTLTE